MPCCSCTTGSPMRTSERSRSIASTFVRRPASRCAAPHDAGVELGLGDEREPRVAPREAGVQRRDDQRDAARRRRRTPRSRRPAAARARTRRSTAASSRAGRRSRRRSARARRSWRRARFSAASGSSARRSTCDVAAAARVGASGGERGARRSAARKLDARERLQRADERVGRQERSRAAASSGRALSPRSSR